MDPRTGLDDVEKRKFLTLQGLKADPSVVQAETSALSSKPFSLNRDSSSPIKQLICEEYPYKNKSF
jgi:hypothetical protein